MKSKKIINKVFVYGTLKVGGHFAQSFNGVRVSSKDATIEGTMFSIGNQFPAVVLEGDTTIIGELHEYDNITDVLRHLDFIEGYSKGNEKYNLYNRSIATIKTEDGDDVEAWIYTFNQSTVGMYKIESGYWSI